MVDQRTLRHAATYACDLKAFDLMLCAAAIAPGQSRLAACSKVWLRSKAGNGTHLRHVGAPSVIPYTSPEYSLERLIAFTPSLSACVLHDASVVA